MNDPKAESLAKASSLAAEKVAALAKAFSLASEKVVAFTKANALAVEKEMLTGIAKEMNPGGNRRARRKIVAAIRRKNKEKLTEKTR